MLTNEHKGAAAPAFPGANENELRHYLLRDAAASLDRVNGCLPGCVSTTAAVPQIAADLLQRASQQSWAKNGNVGRRKLIGSSA